MGRKSDVRPMLKKKKLSKTTAGLEPAALELTVKRYNRPSVEALCASHCATPPIREGESPLHLYTPDLSHIFLHSDMTASVPVLTVLTYYWLCRPPYAQPMLAKDKQVVHSFVLSVSQLSLNLPEHCRFAEASTHCGRQSATLRTGRGNDCLTLLPRPSSFDCWAIACDSLSFSSAVAMIHRIVVVCVSVWAK